MFVLSMVVAVIVFCLAFGSGYWQARWRQRRLQTREEHIPNLNPQLFIHGCGCPICAAHTASTSILEGCVRNPEAESKAYALLLSHLTPKQRETLETKKYFDINVYDSPGHCYRVWVNRSVYNVTEYEYFQPKRQLCTLPDVCGLVTFDIILAQKLMLEANPQMFMRIANRRSAAMSEPGL